MENIAKLAMHLKICPFPPNSTKKWGRNTIVSSYTSFALYPLRCVLYNRTECRQGFSICYVSFNFDISTVKRLIICVTTNLLIWRKLRKTTAFVNKIYDITTTNYSYLETSAINVSDQDCVHVAIAIN